MKVCKFGGTSMANAECIKRVRDIIAADEQVAYVVVSAPGKREKSDTKVTDLLYACFDDVNVGKSPVDAFAPVKERFDSIIKGLGLTMDLSGEYTEIENRLAAGATKDYIASRGEYLSAIVLAGALGWKFVDAADFVRFDETATSLPTKRTPTPARFSTTSSERLYRDFTARPQTGKSRRFLAAVPTYRELSSRARFTPTSTRLGRTSTAL